MDRLQKKCFIVTGAGHGLLVLVLLFGSALMPTPKGDDVKLLHMIDLSTVTDGATKGGDPNAAIPSAPPGAQKEPPKAEVAPPPPPAPEIKHVEPPPVKPPEPVKREEPVKHEQPVEQPKPIRNNRPDLTRIKPVKTHEPKNNKLTAEELIPTTTSKPKPRHSKIDPDSLRPVKRKVDDRAKAEREAQEAADKAAAKAERDHQMKLAKLFSSTMKDLGHGLSTATLVQTPPGFGGGGEASVNYRDLIASKYYNAWNPPAYLDQETAPVTARVTIGRDGNVISAHITRGSGVSAMDKSIQNVLEIVTFFEPFPAGSSDQQRTFTIQFNLQAKRQIG